MFVKNSSLLSFALWSVNFAFLFLKFMPSVVLAAASRSRAAHKEPECSCAKDNKKLVYQTISNDFAFKATKIFKPREAEKKSTEVEESSKETEEPFAYLRMAASDLLGPESKKRASIPEDVFKAMKSAAKEMTKEQYAERLQKALTISKWNIGMMMILQKLAAKKKSQIDAELASLKPVIEMNNKAAAAAAAKGSEEEKAKSGGEEKKNSTCALINKQQCFYISTLRVKALKYEILLEILKAKLQMPTPVEAEVKKPAEKKSDELPLCSKVKELEAAEAAAAVKEEKPVASPPPTANADDYVKDECVFDDLVAQTSLILDNVAGSDLNSKKEFLDILLGVIIKKDNGLVGKIGHEHERLGLIEYKTTVEKFLTELKSMVNTPVKC